MTDRDNGTDDRIHLVVVFGGQSAEHDVSCTTAAHVLAAADPAKYRITPIGISTDGTWALADAAAAALESGDQLPGQLEPARTTVSPTPLLSAATGATTRTVVMPPPPRPLGEAAPPPGPPDPPHVPYVRPAGPAPPSGAAHRRCGIQQQKQPGKTGQA